MPLSERNPAGRPTTISSEMREVLNPTHTHTHTFTSANNKQYAHIIHIENDRRREEEEERNSIFPASVRDLRLKTLTCDVLSHSLCL